MIEHRFVQIRPDLRLHVAHGGKGAGPLVVLLHGFPECWYSWRHQLEPLVAAGFEVAAPDMRGYNTSDKPRGVASYETRLLIEDLKALVGALGHGSAHVVGHDWGGVVAWGAAALEPALVRTLTVLNAPHPRIFYREVKRPRQLLRSWYMGLFQLPVLPEFIVTRRRVLEGIRAAAVHPERFSDADLDELHRAMRQEGAATAALNYYRAAARNPLRGVDVIGRPTLVVWGMKDQALGPWMLDGLEAYVPDLRLVRIEDAGHSVQQEVPEDVTRHLLEFLRSPAARG